MMADVGSKREAELRKKEICRFCLAQHSKLAPIYIENSRIKSTAPLPLQIMAITSIEVQRNDEMPKFICLDCRLLFEHCYRFKQMCKNADTLLRQYPLTGKWPEALTKPRAPILDNQVQPKKLLNSLANTVQVQSVEVLETNFLTKKLLNTAAVSTPEPPAPPRASPQKLKQSSMTSYQVKVENNEELSMDDVQNMLADISEELHETDIPSVSLMSPDKPKVLNKSSVRLLNKGSTTSLEPRLSKPQLKHCKDGNVTLVTEILQPDATDSSTDPIKNTAPVPTNVFSCSDCDRSFPLKQLLDIHSMNHTRTRSFQCQQCEKAFFSKYDLQKHTIIHTGERPYKCSVCEKTFTRRALLHRHERTHTDVPKFICLVCERPFISREEMEKHAERHAKKRPFKCGICQKAFAFKQGLERHEVIHSTNLPFPCQYCNRSFVTAGKLARHLVAHAGKRIYPCKYCPKSYLLSHHLSRHVRMHKQASASSFFCSVCKDAYQTYESLVDHSTVHANATLICPLCNANLGESGNVAAHIEEHKESERHACEFCDLIFLSSSFLQKHIEDDHVVDMVPYQNDEENENEEEGIKEEEMEEEFLAELLTEAEVASSSPSPPQAKAQARKSDTKIDKTKRDSRSRTIKQETVSPDNLKRTRISQKSPTATSVSPEGKRQTRHQGKEKTVTPTDTGKRGLKRITVEQKITKQRNGRSSK